MENYKLINLRDLRMSKNLTQYELGKKLGFTKSAISNYENGNRIPDINVLVLYSRFFEVSIDYIVGNQDFSNADADANTDADANKSIIQQPSIDKIKADLIATFDLLCPCEQSQVSGFAQGLLQANKNN